MNTAVIYTENALAVDREVRDSITVMRSSVLEMSLGLAKIKNECLYRELGFQFMSHYVARLCEETKMDRSSINKWLKIGQAYEKYREELERIGFGENDSPTKLRYLERALKNCQGDDVFAALKRMTVREFMAYSRGPAAEDEAERPFVEVKGDNVLVGGYLAVRINRELPVREIRYFKKVNAIAGRAMEEGEYIFPVRLRDWEEIARYEKFSEKLIAQLRSSS
jgi:hypothetical protein